MSMLDENSFAGLACAETHGLGTENVQNRNMSLVMKISATRDPTSDVDDSATLTQICPRPLYFHLPEPTSACNINHVGFDHHCLHSSHVVLWGDIFGAPPVHPDDAFNVPSRRKRSKPSDLTVLLPPGIFGAVHPPALAPAPPPYLPIVQAPAPSLRPTAARLAHAPLHPPSVSGVSVPARPAATATPASQLAPPESSSQLAPRPTASRSALPPADAPKEASTKARPLPPPKKQSKPSFLSFSDDGIQSIKQHNRRVGSSIVGAKNSLPPESASAVNAEMPPPPVEDIPRADEQPDFTVFSPPSSHGGFVFPGQVNFSGSSSLDD